MYNDLFTIGHSNHDLQKFIDLLGAHAIEAVADVRSSPYSLYCPQFNRESLMAALKRSGIRYAYFGDELGARTEDPACRENGRVVYARLALTDSFQAGLRRLKSALRVRPVALMCAEKDPLTCHRTILVCRSLRNEPFPIQHILENGMLETQQQAERRLMEMLNIVSPNLFYTDEELIDEAYETQGAKIAHALPEEAAANRQIE